MDACYNPSIAVPRRTGALQPLIHASNEYQYSHCFQGFQCSLYSITSQEVADLLLLKACYNVANVSIHYTNYPAAARPLAENFPVLETEHMTV